MAVTLRFVDQVVASPNIRLDLNSGVWTLSQEGTDFGFPEVGRSVVTTAMRDGASVQVSSHGLRNLTLRLLVNTTDANAVATATQALYRELDRDENILMFAPHTSTPVFFKTFRTAPDSVQMITSGAQKFIQVTLPADSYAIGLKETIAAQTVNQDPAHATNPNYLDFSNVKGDAETPMFISFTENGNGPMIFATRRRGTVSQVPYLKQVESMTMGTDTTTQANSTAFSGTSNNYARCSFATTASDAQRASSTIAQFATASAGLRGTYRVFCRYRVNTSGTVKMHLVWGAETGDPGFNYVSNAATPALGTSGGPTFADLGEVTIPWGGAPQYDGQSGTELAYRGVKLQLWAERVSGTGTLDMDYLIFVPADDQFSLVTLPATSGQTVFLDALDNSMHVRTGSEVTPFSVAETRIVGWLPFLQPGVTNRVYMIDTVPTTTWLSLSITVAYWPRYLEVAPA